MTIRDDIITQARARLGIPYGLPPGPGQTDCSMYVRDVFAAAGIPFQSGVRTAEQERQASVPIGWDEVEPGDLLYFENTYDAGPVSADGHIASHIGISLGKGTHRMLNAVEPVSKESDISTPYWQPKLFEARRHPALAGAQESAPIPAISRPRGIDVSSHQGIVDWGAVASSGIAFAFIKASEGIDYLNPNFERDWSLTRRTGIFRGAYHYARPEKNTAATEADWFVDQVEAHGGLSTGDILALDLESGNGDVGQWALDFLHRVETRVKFKPLVYTGRWFSDAHSIGDYPELSSYGLWLAAYSTTIPAPPDPWTMIAFHQYSDQGSVPGVQGNVDLNHFNGSLERLPLYGKPSSEIPAPVDLRVELEAILARHDPDAALTDDIRALLARI